MLCEARREVPENLGQVAENPLLGIVSSGFILSDSLSRPSLGGTYLIRKHIPDHIGVIAADHFEHVVFD
ncbi:hypothetical protein AFCDBAGC_2701 [Methylobacterium cerastii]|uniref:Uncharacterized protein n=1 Tax=Methylobacterium cerastii TaxID=932741 RepID=A0ABQ4QHX7_9HYPH|nr:hypothetical protein AFCDBAGC_2701 [Methylobacterium cerastii]